MLVRGQKQPLASHVFQIAVSHLVAEAKNLWTIKTPHGGLRSGQRARLEANGATTVNGWAWTYPEGISLDTMSALGEFNRSEIQLSQPRSGRRREWDTQAK
jgi:hypothetical protein